MRPDLLIGLVGLVLFGAAAGGVAYLQEQGQGPVAQYTIAWDEAAEDFPQQGATIPDGGGEEFAFEVVHLNVTRVQVEVGCTDNFAGSALVRSRVSVELSFNGTVVRTAGPAPCQGPVPLETMACPDPPSLAEGLTPGDALRSANVTGAACLDGTGNWTVAVRVGRQASAPGGASTVTVDFRYERYLNPRAQPVTK